MKVVRRVGGRRWRRHYPWVLRMGQLLITDSGKEQFIDRTAAFIGMDHYICLLDRNTPNKCPGECLLSQMCFLYGRWIINYFFMVFILLSKGDTLSVN